MKGTNSDSPIFFGWYIVATCFFIAFLTVGVRNAFGIFVIPMSEEFGWTRTTISLAAASGFLINGITQPFLGHLFDRIGGRRVIVVGLVLIGICTLLLSLTFHILFMLVVFSFLLSTALSGPSLTNTMALISKWFKRRRATAVSINTVGTSFGGLILVPFAMYFLQAAGWRMTWLILGLLILFLAVPLSLLFIRENPEALGLLPDGDKEYQEQAEYAKTEDRLGEFEVDHWIKSFRSAPMWQLSAAYVVCGVTTGMISTHFVPFAIERGISPGKAALIFVLMMGLNYLGGIGAGVL
ncbi:MAG: MFS transporter, partial [Chloroflexota bacterium]|nr:MFS transporter [Chloroflexota bacterium]